VSAFALRGEVTIEECVKKAEANYPLVKKYGLLSATRDIDLSDINKSWLPKVDVYGQVTGQNIVPSFPETLTDVLDQMGQQMQGLGKIQYKVGADISQTIWDGGVSRARREMVSSQHALEQAALDVELYAVRQKVENIYFAILLTEEQIAQSRVTCDVLNKNLERLRAMLLNGTAMQSDVDMIEAQTLVMNQSIAQAKSAVAGYRRMLELFIGESLDGQTLAMPDSDDPLSTEPQRPELRLLDCKLEINRAADRLNDTYLMPKIGLFAQAYYGYPGFDYFKSMINRDLSINLIAGVKLSWNIDSFYTRKNNRRKTSLDNDKISVDRDAFLFNTGLQTASQYEAIKGLREVMKDDKRIIVLRGNVRHAAESQLANGIIDATSLLTKISDENIAQLTAKLHEIQLLQEIYKLKYTLNR
ncbi:MAG: TolC family protein, partial [Muribaculaceae bacterium]|nr:TolC family protein [Muribaculaceae bacterium]